MKFKILGTCIILFLLSCKSKEIIPADNMQFETTNLIYYAQPDDFDTLLAYAKKANKMIFMEFVADWCLPCKVMEESTFSNLEVAALMNKNFINYRIDYDSEEGKSLALLFQANQLPSLYFLDGRGRVVIQYSGQLMPTDMTSMAEQALELFKDLTTVY